MRISDWSSDVCSSDLGFGVGVRELRMDTVAGEFLLGAGFSRESRLCLRPGKPNTPTLLLRSGRRWREAPDEGASAASCFCFSPPAIRHSQKQRFAALARPHPPPAFAGAGSSGTFSRKREKGCIPRSEATTSELQSLLRNSYAVFCWKKKKATLDRLYNTKVSSMFQ